MSRIDLGRPGQASRASWGGQLSQVPGEVSVAGEVM